MKMSTLMKTFGWVITQVGEVWNAKSTIAGVEYSYKDGKWNNDPSLMVALEVALSEHDWTYPMSDDGREWDSGEAERKRILTMCRDLDLSDDDLLSLRRKHRPSLTGCYELQYDHRS